MGTSSITDLSSPGFDRGTEGRVGEFVTGQRRKTPQAEPQQHVMDTGQGDNEAVGTFVHEDARARAGDLARDWGLKDPTVARAMMKRAKRMRKFQNVESRREKLKDPHVRFDVFARNAGGRRTVSEV